jgi:hypothetical protein
MTTILALALGLVFVYLLFSLLVSAVNEAVFGHLTHLRARVLEDSLRAIISDNAKGFSASALIGNTVRALLAKIPSRKTHPSGSVVNSPPTESPVPAVVNALASEAETFSDKLLQHPLFQGLISGRARFPSYVPAETFVDGVIGTLLNLGSASSPPSASPNQITIAQIVDAVDRLPDSYAKKVISSVLAGAESPKEARQRLETWFNNSMQRVSGTYKRYSQFWLYVWASVLVLWLNVDTIEICRRLMADAQLRNALASGAFSFVQTNSAGNPVSGAGGPPAPQTNPIPVALSVPQLLQEISTLNLPIGWGSCASNASAKTIIGRVITWLPRFEQSASVSTNSASYMLASAGLAPAAPCPSTPEAWRLKLLGLIISIAAISQGAPFWFDLLNRVTNVRAAGKPPQPKTGPD